MGVLLFAAHSLVSFSQQPVRGPATLLGEAQSEEGRGDFMAALSHYNAALQLDPGNSEAIFGSGRLRARCGDFNGAAAAFRRVLRSDPAWAEAHYNLGLTLIAGSPTNPDWASAMPEFEAALKLRPDYPEASNMVGVGRIETGQAASAVPVFQSALASSPNSAELHFNYARALESIGKTDDTAFEYAAALKIRKEYPEAESALGNLSLNRKDYRSAVLHFKSTLALNPDMQGAHYGLAKALKALGETHEAQVEFQEAGSLVQRQSDAVISSHLSNAGLDQAKNGDFSGAVQTVRKALALDPTNAIAHYNLGLLLADTGDLQGGMLELRKSISLMPMRLSAYVDMSRMQLKLNDRAGARVSLQKAALLDPKAPGVQNGLAALRDAMHLPASSEPIPQEPAPSFLLGAPQDSAAGHFAFAAQLSKEGDNAGAIGELRRALTLAPAETETRYRLALAYMQSGASQSALLELRKMLFASPGSVEAHLALGTLLLEANSGAEAAAELKRVLVLQPDNREASRLLARAQAVPASP
jgi:tetratricopeptide (TPR) repeat protein